MRMVKRDATTLVAPDGDGRFDNVADHSLDQRPENNQQRLADGSPQLEVLKNIPATWDETRVLDVSQIGSWPPLPAAKAIHWFLAMVSGDPE